jgi:hypothetical protein
MLLSSIASPSHHSRSGVQLAAGDFKRDQKLMPRLPRFRLAMHFIGSNFACYKSTGGKQSCNRHPVSRKPLPTSFGSKCEYALCEIPGWVFPAQRLA